MKTFTKRVCENTKNSTLIVYGTGAVGEIVYHGLTYWGRKPDFFCDHDPDKKMFFNIEVLTPEALKQIQSAVVIVAFKDFIRSAVGILKEYAINEYYSALDLIELKIKEDVLSVGAQEFLVRKRNYSELVDHAEDDDWICFQHLEFVVTERCTLKCKDCSALVPYFTMPKDLDIIRACDAFDKVLESLDQVVELSVLGGEPLLNKQIYKLIERYDKSNKINSIVIYTNGTVIPDKELLRFLRSPKVWVHISDYGKYSSKIYEMSRMLEENRIRYFIRKYDKWQAVGGLEKRSHTKEKLEWMYSRCFKARCYSFYDNKLYCCARASSGAVIGIIPDTDYIDYSVPASMEERKEQLRILINKKYIDACRFCDGMIAGYADVEPAIQMEKGDII